MGNNHYLIVFEPCQFSKNNHDYLNKKLPTHIFNIKKKGGVLFITTKKIICKKSFQNEANIYLYSTPLIINNSLFLIYNFNSKKIIIKTDFLVNSNTTLIKASFIKIPLSANLYHLKYAISKYCKIFVKAYCLHLSSIIDSFASKTQTYNKTVYSI